MLRHRQRRGQPFRPSLSELREAASRAVRHGGPQKYLEWLARRRKAAKFPAQMEIGPVATPPAAVRSSLTPVLARFLTVQEVKGRFWEHVADLYQKHLTLPIDGHGVVFPNPFGMKVRCMGPGRCSPCNAEWQKRYSRPYPEKSNLDVFPYLGQYAAERDIKVKPWDAKSEISLAEWISLHSSPMPTGKEVIGADLATTLRYYLQKQLV